jgi:hypothetical protein
MTTLALLLAAFLLLGIGIAIGLKLAGALGAAPVDTGHMEAMQGAKWADGVRKGRAL